MMRKVFAIIKNNILSIFSKGKLLSIIGTFIIINVATEGFFSLEITNFNDIIKFSFYGVESIEVISTELFKIIFYQVILFYLCISFVHNEIKNRSTLMIMRIGSRRLWGITLVISIVLLSVIYNGIGFLVIGILNYKMFFCYIDFMGIVNLYSLLVVVNTSILLIATLLSILIENEGLILIILLFLYLGAIIIGDKYLIFNQALLIKYDKSVFSYAKSYMYSSIFFIITYILIKFKIRELEF